VRVHRVHTRSVSFRGWRAGARVLVLPNGWDVSDRCYACNAPAPAKALRCSLAYIPAGYFLTLLLGILIGIFVIAIVMQRGYVTVGLCGRHAEKRGSLRRTALWLLATWPLTLGSLFFLPVDLRAYFLGLPVIATILTIVLWYGAEPVRAKDIKNSYLWVTGWGPDFVAMCPPLPETTAVAEQRQTANHQPPTTPG